MKKPLVKMNMYDRAVAIFNPGKAYRNARDRSALNLMASSVSRTAAGGKGTLGNWFVKRLNRFSEGRERVITTDRADDLIANNAHAASIVDSTALHVVGGVGLTPQSRPNHKVLGITEEQAQEIAEQAEFWFGVWCKQADAEGLDHFCDLQKTTIRTMAGKGEFLNLPVMLEETVGGRKRDFSFAIQVLEPRRLRTPLNLAGDRDIRDGIRLGDNHERLSYFLADPDDGKLTSSLTSNSFQEIPAWFGHRPGIFHGFIKKDPEQVRGVSCFAPVMKLFKDYDDYMDFEVVGQILQASFPVFIEVPEGDDADDYVGETATEGTSKAKEYSPGQVIHGTAGQKPHVLKSDRPGGSFPVFVETLLRAIGAAAGLPYEIVAKDFSRTNYSSARAAMLEAYRLFCMYQVYLENHFCQPTWEMVFEEAWLRGYIKLPKGAPDFYQARAAYTAAKWIPPKRGAVDPVKEIAAGKEEIISNMGTMADWFAEQGEDWQEQLRQIARERKMMKDLGLTMSDLPGFDLKNLATQPEQQAA